MPHTKHMMKKIFQFAEQYEEIRMLTLEGSRANRAIQYDCLQDYDISCFMQRDLIASFRQNLTWMEYFGKCIMVQMPEEMQLFPPDLRPGWFSYLMIFEDGVRVDLTFIPLDDKDFYFRNETPVKILLDKDQCAMQMQASQSNFCIQELNQRVFDDCVNEFYWLYHCAHKGILRKELLYVNTHIEMIRESLLIMLSWRVAIKKIKHMQDVYQFDYSFGKHYKFLPDYLCANTRNALYKTYCLGDIKKAKKVLKRMESLFYTESLYVAKKSGISQEKLKLYQKSIGVYLKAIKRLYKKKHK